MLYGVYNLFNHHVTMPNDPFAAPSERNVHLAHAPTNPREFSALALQMAEILKPHQASTKPLESVEKEIVAQILSFSGESDGQHQQEAEAVDVTRRPGDPLSVTAGHP